MDQAAASPAPVQPRLSTPRLCLRPFSAADAPAVQRLAGDARVALPTAAVPHPYPDGAAEAWIATHAAAFAARQEVSFAICLRQTDELIGAISLMQMHAGDARAEVGYWIGVDHWGRGYCSEALVGLIGYAHQGLGLTRIVARCAASNPGSARVMEKAGLVREGLLRQHTRKQGRFEDMLLYGMVLPGRQG